METIPQKRIDDLDSIVYGTPSNGQIKVYVNSREDTVEDIEQRINLLRKTLTLLKGEK